MKNLAKYAFSGHNAVAHHFINLTSVMTLFTNLGHAQNNIITFKHSPHRQISEIIAGNNKVFPKGSKFDLCAPGPERLDLFQ